MKKDYLKVIVLVLMVIISVQAYYLYDLNRTQEKNEIKIPFSFPEGSSLESFFHDEDNPFIEMERLRREVENSFRNFDNFFQTFPFLERLSSQWYRIPRFDMKDQDGSYIITMEIPGSDKQAIDVKVENGQLKVSAKVSEEKDDNATTYYRHERRTSSYKRIITLPKDADEKSLESDYKKGLLILTIDKKSSK